MAQCWLSIATAVSHFPGRGPGHGIAGAFVQGLPRLCLDLLETQLVHIVGRGDFLVAVMGESPPPCWPLIGGLCQHLEYPPPDEVFPLLHWSSDPTAAGFFRSPGAPEEKTHHFGLVPLL